MDVRTTGGSLPCGRYLLAPLTVDKEGSKSLMAQRVKPTQTRFPTNSLYTPIDNTPLGRVQVFGWKVGDDPLSTVYLKLQSRPQ